MRGSFASFLSSLCALLVGVLISQEPARLCAQESSSVVVLSIQSLEGDDDIARTVSELVRQAAREIPSWQLNPSEVGLSQMLLTQSCEEADLRCLKRIAKALKAHLVVFGTLERGDPSQTDSYRVNLTLYNRSQHQMDRTFSETFLLANSENLQPAAKRWVRSLADLPASATLQVRVNVPGAEICLDTQCLGITDDQGYFTLADLDQGVYDLEVRAPGYGLFHRTFSVKPGQEISVDVALEENKTEVRAPRKRVPVPEAPERDSNWLAWSAIAIGSIAAAMTAYSWVRIKAIEDEPAYSSYRIAAGPMVSDICVAAEDGENFNDSGINQDQIDHVKSLCNESKTLGVLQYVFLGTAVVAGTTGAILLLSDDSDSKGTSGAHKTSLSLAPDLSPTSGSLTAILRF